MCDHIGEKGNSNLWEGRLRKKRKEKKGKKKGA